MWDPNFGSVWMCNSKTIALLDLIFYTRNIIAVVRSSSNSMMNQNQNRFIRSYYRPRRPPLRPIWSLSQRPPGKKHIHECM